MNDLRRRSTAYTNKIPSDVEYIEADRFGTVFMAGWEAMHRRFVKLEWLQEYAQPGEHSYEALMEGRFYEACQLIREGVLGQQEMYDAARSRGVEFIRLRVLALPMTDYLKYEFISYLASTELGEDIYIVNVEDLSPDLLLSDLVMFDDNECLIHDYDPGSLALRGAWRTSDDELVSNIVKAADELLASAVPLSKFNHIP